MRFQSKTAGILAFLLAGIVLPGNSFAAPGQVEDIRVQGLSRMTRDAFMFQFQVRVGDPYDEVRLRARFKELWSLKVFEDITIETEDAADGGKAIIVKVRERPTLSSVTYEDNKVVTQTQIEDRYKERSIRLGLGRPVDMGEIYFAESAIRDLLSEQGYLDAEVSSELSIVTDTARSLKFKINPGGKTRIRTIQFKGNELFSSRKLKSALELTQERKWYWPFSGKNLYHPVKWDQDVSKLRELYQNRGYLDVELRAPVVEVRRGKQAKDGGDSPAPRTARLPEPVKLPKGDLSPKQQAKYEKKQLAREEKLRKAARRSEARAGKRWVHLTVPVVEGSQYRLGDLEFSGNEVFSDEILRAQIPLAAAGVLNDGLLEFGVDRITRVYEDRGHLYASVVRRIKRREGENIADVEVVIEEDEPYFVGQIDFQGNSATHDRVLRRELQLVEGQLFSRSQLDVSRAKVNQLGYFEVTGEPVIDRMDLPNRVRITFNGEEKGRNEIQVGGGYSGLDGAFFNGVYSTRNFLGRGQVLSTALQIGGRSNRYQISFQEPWFLNRPYLFGLSLFRRDTDYGASLRSTSRGGGAVVGRRLGRFSRMNLGYSYEQVDSSTVTLGTGLPVSSNNRISSLTPVFSFSTVNNPYRPSRGQALNLSFQLAGGPLGGDTDFLKPRVDYTVYRRAFGRSLLAFHLDTGLVREIGSSSAPRSGDVAGIPLFQRFWLGGDTVGPRAFETRTITPRRYVAREGNNIVNVYGDARFTNAGNLVTAIDPLSGEPVIEALEVGGDRMYLLQSEWVLPLNEQAELAAFLDVGDTLFEDTSFGFDTTRISAGVEMRFHLPIFPVPLRLIYGVPVRKLDGDRTSNFTFSIGRSF